MLKITERAQGDAMTVEVIGKLVGPWANELERYWRDVGRSGSFCLDLTGATSIDASGIEVLRAMHARGVKLVAGDCYMRAIVDDICQVKPT